MLLVWSEENKQSVNKFQHFKGVSADSKPSAETYYPDVFPGCFRAPTPLAVTDTRANAHIGRRWGHVQTISGARLVSRRAALRPSVSLSKERRRPGAACFSGARRGVYLVSAGAISCARKAASGTRSHDQAHSDQRRDLLCSKEKGKLEGSISRDCSCDQ